MSTSPATGSTSNAAAAHSAFRLAKQLQLPSVVASDLVALDEALTALTEMDRRKGQVVEMRFFGGLSVKEVAEVLKVSEETVMRDWRLAKVWLFRELGREAGSEA